MFEQLAAWLAVSSPRSHSSETRLGHSWRKVLAPVNDPSPPMHTFKFQIFVLSFFEKGSFFKSKIHLIWFLNAHQITLK
jgi:hypothetical protein